MSSWIPEKGPDSNWIPEADTDIDSRDVDNQNIDSKDIDSKDIDSKDIDNQPTYDIEYKPKAYLVLENSDTKNYGLIRDITDPSIINLSSCEVVGSWSKSRADNLIKLSLIESIDAIYDKALQAWADFEQITFPEPKKKRAPKSLPKPSKPKSEVTEYTASKDSTVKKTLATKKQTTNTQTPDKQSSAQTDQDIAQAKKEAVEKMHSEFNSLRSKLKKRDK